MGPLKLIVFGDASAFEKLFEYCACAWGLGDPVWKAAGLRGPRIMAYANAWNGAWSACRLGGNTSVEIRAHYLIRGGILPT